MPAYYYENLPISTLFNCMRKGSIDVEPSYQREIVWSHSMQEKLIETLLEGFPMPSINFVENNDPSLPKYECMDGKNRLKSIEKYMKGEISVGGIRFDDRTDDEKEDFRSINVQVCIFKQLSYDQRREYFRRIQEGKSLQQTEIVWSFEDRPLIIELRKVRKSHLNNISQLWETDRYSDMTLLCNLAAIAMGDNVARDSAGHSSAMTNWVKKSPTEGNFNVVGQVVKKMVQMLTNLLTVEPNKKAKPWVVLDLARVLFSKGFKGVTEQKVITFVTELNQYMVNDEETELEGVAEYADIIFEGACSKQYTCKNIEKRFEILKKIF